ncbi:RNA methyltransferase, TrmH family [Hathewaya proteolytica DSM 3090]|uniref:RNA methyltransferase, TrmH family n=1 Tax=Hathewaya proteolytica DSM 3090 TaxID=1121331 RepID=A0A1M6JNN0_9CLOT|nr:TrmH family RNA methyltransferase [Hathewaya proteolytica]SHJ48359.1 RNA methyltransferase, TrmH family [Hathewaya proteolytica DSM 3090]
MSSKKYKKTNETSYSLGITLTVELLKKKPQQVEKLYFHSDFEKKEVYYEIEKICQEHRIPIETGNKIFNVVSNKENCYVIGEFKKFEGQAKKSGKHVVLVNPSNSGNLGTILRSASGFGISSVIIINPAVDIFDPKTVRASMGAIFNVDFRHYDSFEAYYEEFSERKMYPFMLQASKSIQTVDFEEDCSLVFGNEATGLPPRFLNIGQSLIIPHTKNIDSLNLPIAVSIAIYEATKKQFNMI